MRNLLTMAFMMAFMAFFSAQSEAQKKFEPHYFTIGTIGLNTWKDYSGASKKSLYTKWQGVYGGKKLGLSYHALKVHPWGGSTGQDFEKYTVVSLGVGKIIHLEKESKVIVGSGPTVATVRRHGVIPKTDDFFYGATMHCNYVNGVHIGGDITYVTKSNPNEWNKGMTLAELETIFFFNKTVGIKAMYGLEIGSDIEKQIPGVQFNQNRHFHNVSNLTGGICLRFGSAIVFFGPTIRTEGSNYSFIDQFGTYQKGKSRHNPPMGLNLSLNFDFESD